MESKDTARRDRAEEIHSAVQFAVKEDIEDEYGTSGNEKAAQRKTVPSVKKLRSTAVKCLNEMMTDMSLKPADRLNAIKAVLDYTSKQIEEKERDKQKNDLLDDGAVHVIFDNAPKEYAE